MVQDQKEATARMQEAIAKAWQMVEKYAARKGYQLNPNRSVTEKIVRSLARRQILHGYRYCP